MSAHEWRLGNIGWGLMSGVCAKCGVRRTSGDDGECTAGWTPKSIWKFQLPVVDRVAIQMPVGARILTVQTQGDGPFLWAMVNERAAQEARYFNVIGTDRSITDDPGDYIGTFQLFSGGLVFHVFEQR